MKKFLKGAIAIIVIIAVISGCNGKNQEGYVEIPFGDSDSIGQDCNEIVAELEEAGFSNITTEEENTTIQTLDGTIKSIKVNGSSVFLKGNKYAPDVAIEITYSRFQEKEEEKETQQEEVQQEEEITYSADADSIERMAKDLFDFEYEELSVSYDDFDEAYVVIYRPVNVLSISTFVYQNINRYIHFCQEAYQIEGLERVRFDVMLLGQDQYGADYEIEGLSEIMTKESFAKFNWDNLEYMDIYDAFVDECYYFGIAPEIVGEVDKTQVFYDPFTRDGKIQ
jgi:hypothetical protein